MKESHSQHSGVDTSTSASADITPKGWQDRCWNFVTGGVTNPWIRIVIYVVTMLLTACLYFGWQAYSKILIRGGAYEWLCNESNIGDITDPDDPALCEDQSKAVARLYAFANGSEYVCACIAGILLDTIGPRRTAMVGQAVKCIAFILMAYSSQSFQAYIPGLMLSGSAVNIISFPALTIMEAWPDHTSLALGVIIGSQISASVVAPIIISLWDQHPSWTYRNIFLCYIICVWAPIACIYVWALPKNRNFESLVDQQEDPASLMEDPHPQAISDEDSAPSWSAYLRNLLTWEMLAMAIFFGMLMFHFAYYPAVERDALGTSVSDFSALITPLQGPFSVLIGFVMDLCGSVPVMYFMCASLISIELLCSFLADRVRLMKTVAFFVVFVQSGTYNVKYTFVTEMFDPYNFGKLVGTLGLCGGIGVYISSPLTQQSGYDLMFRILAGLVAVMVLAATFIWFRQKVKHVSYKTKGGAAGNKRIH